MNAPAGLTGALRDLPHLLMVEEVAGLLRTSRKAIYASAAAGLIPGVVRPGRRLLFRRDAVLGWLDLTIKEEGP
jgi:excisionase family DNA binding protein